MMFDKFVDLSLNNIWKDMQRTLNDSGGSALIDIDSCASLKRGMRRKILSFSLRALIQEMYCKKECGMLQGSNSAERFKFFEDMAGTKTYAEELFTKYPVLKTKIDTYCMATRDYVVEIVNHLQKDQKEVERIIGISIKHINDIEIESGDSHNGGKTVSILLLDSGKVVYKPHSLHANILFARLLDLVNKNAGLMCDLNAVKCLSRKKYGWEEFVRFQDCDSIEGVKRYYYRMGCYCYYSQPI